jgi:hypothetical protein
VAMLLGKMLEERKEEVTVVEVEFQKYQQH